MHHLDNTPKRSFVLPAWARVGLVFILGLSAPALGRYLGRVVGDEGLGAAVVVALFVTLLVFMTVGPGGSRVRAAVKGLAAGVVVGGLFWYFSR